MADETTLAVMSCDGCPLCWKDPRPDGLGAWCQHPEIVERRVANTSEIPKWCPLRAASLRIITVTIEEDA